MTSPASRPYDAIFFDAGYTLLEPAVPHVDRYLSIAETHGGTPVERDRLFAHLREYWSTSPQPGPDADPNEYATCDETYAEWWAGHYRAVFEHLGVPETNLADAITDMYASFHDPELWRLYPDTQDVLEELSSRGIRMGICSNWSSGLQNVIDGLQLRSYFAFVHTSAEVGVLKPGHRMFERGLEDTGLDAARVLHVGDTWDADIIGAARAGIRGVFINRWKNAPDDADLVIEELRELLDLLDS